MDETKLLYEIPEGQRELFRHEDELDPEKVVINSKMDRAVEDALNSLDGFRDAVVLRDIEGFQYKEIAGFLEIPLGTVTSMLHRGRKRLRNKLIGYVIKNEVSRVADALNKMPQYYKQVLELFYANELSCADIASALNISVGTVYSRLNRGRNILKGFLENPSYKGPKRVSTRHIKYSKGFLQFFPRYIKERVPNKSASKKEIARQIGITIGHLKHLERGKRLPSDVLVDALAIHLGQHYVDFVREGNLQRAA